MKKKISKWGSLALAVILTTGIVAGCGGKSTEGNPGNVVNPQPIDEAFQYPVKGNPRLTYLTRVTPPGYQNYSEMPWYKVQTEKTGVTVEYTHAVAGQEKEQLNLMIASRDLPDIVKSNWSGYSGGPEKAISDGVIIPLKDAVNKYAPNFKKALQTYKELDKSVKTDSGEYYNFPMVRTHEKLLVFEGLYMRNDWLTDLGLKVPETIDELYVVLKAFKEKKGADAPLSYYGGNIKGGLGKATICGAYGIYDGFYVENGKVKYGPIEPAFREYLATMVKWYKEGLIDKDIATVDRKLVQSKILNGKSGAMYGLLGGDMGALLTSTSKKDPAFDLVAAPYPVLKKGEKPKFGQRDAVSNYGESVAISTKCKDIQTAVRFLDWGYSEEGMMLYNFGIEGQSYKMENGYPTYMGMKPGQIIPEDYLRINGPGLNDVRYVEQFVATPQQKKAIETWAATDMEKYMMPAVIPTPEEGPEEAKIISEIGPYVNEMFLKFMLGAESMDKYDAFVDQMKKLGIEKAIQIKQAGLERYNKR